MVSGGIEGMAGKGRKKAHTLEEIVAKLRQAEVLVGQGKTVADTVRAIGVTEPTYYRWRTEFGGLKLDQVKRLKELERENARLRKVVSDLTLEKVILKEAASGKWCAPRGGGPVSSMSCASLTFRSGRPARCRGSTDRRSGGHRGAPTTRLR
jgi:transposase-like protein